MRSAAKLALHALALLPIVLLGCAASHEGKTEPADDFAGTTADGLSVFASKSKVVATLDAFAGAVDVDYTASPLYRAIKVQAEVGDWVKITVHPNGTGGVSKAVKKPATADLGDPVTWLLDSKYAVVAKNDDVQDGTKDSLIVTQLKKSGTFYVVVRDYDYASFHFDVELSMARASADPVADANMWFQFFIEGDDYDTLADRFAVPMSKMPAAARADAAGFFTKDVGGATGHAFPWHGKDVLYILTGSAEEAYDARPYDSDGNPIADIAIGGDPGDIIFGHAKTPPSKTPAPGTDVDTAAPSVSKKYGFQQFYKCPSDADVIPLGNQGTMGACLTACQATKGAAGCWYLDGTGGFPHDCRACRTMTPVKMTWANDWARPLP
jgi:hypothetical protein